MCAAVGFMALFNYTLLMAITGTALVGALAGVLGVFLLLRKQSMLGDALSHATLPGIALAFLITHSNNPLILLLGGTFSAAIGGLLIYLITQYTTIKKEVGLGVILSVFFGLGLVFLTHIQKYPIANQAALNKFLFGNASTILPYDIYVMLAVGIITMSALILLWNPLKLMTFDAAFGRTLGFSARALDGILMALCVLVIALGQQAVGVILMSSMLIAPAAAARQWVTRLEQMVLVAMVIGVLAGIGGSLVSSLIDRLPTGPVIVLFLSFFVGASLLFGPRRKMVN